MRNILIGPVPPEQAWSRRVGIVGVGETAYGADYRKSRSGLEDSRTIPDDLAKQAFERALEDGGLRREDIDGLSVSLRYGDFEPEDVAHHLDIKPRYAAVARGIIAGPIPSAVAALMSGKCETIALVYAAAPRSIKRQFGGSTYLGAGTDSYYYYHPWGWSSQAAHWAIMFRHYQAQYGATEEDLGSVAVALRSYAQLNENAIMRNTLSVDQYMQSRYIVKPMHLLDMCLVNDGGVCLILRRREMCDNTPKIPVLVAGWGDAAVPNAKLHYMVKERLRPQLQDAGAQALRMADLTLSDIRHYQGYDASTIHLVAQLEGLGFVAPGQGLEFCKDGNMGIGGRLPVNTSGGLLSEGYMHGWNHVVEAVRQLRSQAGERQVAGLETSMYSLATTEEVHTLVFTS